MGPTAGSCTCFDRNPNSGEASIPNTANGCGFDDEPDASGCVMVSSEDECRIADWIEGAQIQGGCSPSQSSQLVASVLLLKLDLSLARALLPLMGLVACVAANDDEILSNNHGR